MPPNDVEVEHAPLDQPERGGKLGDRHEIQTAEFRASPPISSPPISVEAFTRNLQAVPVISILRGPTPEQVEEIAQALYDGGIRFVEVTLNTPEPLASIRRLAERFAGTGMHVGAGTVLAPAQVDEVAKAGGEYIISPNTDPAVIRRTKERGLVSIPGFLTPSEAFTAVASGADFLKCFPVRLHGPGYLKDLRAVLPTPVVAVGGVNLDNLAEYLEVAVAVGIGSGLYQPRRTPAEIRQAAEQYAVAARR